MALALTRVELLVPLRKVALLLGEKPMLAPLDAYDE
jgi:hypothetical protein